MPADPIPESERNRVSQFIAGALGLHFPPERWPDLQRALEGMAAEWGDAGAAEGVRRLLTVPLTTAQLEVLAAHLTIGETYFFREKKTLEVIAREVLPPLIQARRGGDRRLRLWSAGCCTGEEAYTLAMLLHQLLPDLADWRVTILATDLNPRFLRKAVAGSYGDWSFRDAPEGCRERYFSRADDGRYTVIPVIRDLVTFAPLNLVADNFPSLTTGTEAMDLIFCRNVLMYFTPTQMRSVIARFHRALNEGGWLAVSPSEASQTLFPQFVTVNSPDAILYRKDSANAPRAPVAQTKMRVPFITEEPLLIFPAPLPVKTVAPASLEPPPAAPTKPAPDPQVLARHARDAANQGDLAGALAWCDRWIAADKVDSAAHYLRAVILIEQGEATLARSSLQRAVYLEPEFVLAHFSLGNLAREGGRAAEAGKHFGNARRLLARYQPDDLLPAAEGLTAGRLVETLDLLSLSSSPR